MYMKQFFSVFAAVLLSGILFNPPAHAQYTADYQTNIISGVTSNWSGDYVVGSNTYADVLLIESSAALSDGYGYVGADPEGGSYNVAVVSGARSVWNNSGELYVGGSGDYNQLIVTNGGAVYSLNGYIGFESGDYNTALVTGNGSVWNSTGTLTVGSDEGSSDSITIADGGAVYDHDALLGWWNGGNSVLVTGSGSVWRNENSLTMSGFGANSLTISNGGVVYDDNAEIGSDDNGQVLVTGTGSVWNTSGEMAVSGIYEPLSLTISDGGGVYCGSFRLDGNGNALVTGVGSVWSIGGGLDLPRYNGPVYFSLTIADGGAVFAPGVSSSYIITVSGGGLYVTNGLGTGGLQVNGGIGTLNGGTITADQLSVNDDSSFVFTSGRLASGGTVVSNGQNFVVGDGTNEAVFVLVGGVHSFTDGLQIESKAFLTGCGTIEGSVVVDHCGTVLARCDGTLNFTGSVTNNGIIHVRDGATLNFYGPVVNHGLIEARKGHLRFWAGVKNEGKIVVRRDTAPWDHRRHKRR
jgi:T5SS/PEP-CTERM-associated repeat protein